MAYNEEVLNCSEIKISVTNMMKMLTYSGHVNFARG